jgi:hypothetical protein
MSRAEVRFHAVRLVLGVVLLAAAVLKLSGLNVTAVPRVGWFSTPQVQAAVAAWELVLGLWLLAGAHRTWAWLATVGTFMTFAGVSGYLDSIGVARCGCFGAIRASPKDALGVDMVALALLAIGRPGFRGGAFRLPPGVAGVTAATVAVLLALTGIGSLVYGSPQAALARLRGDALTVSASYVDFGSGAAGQALEATVEVRNWTDHPVRLTGGTSDCTCVTTLDLPMTIPPGEVRPVTLRLALPGSQPGVFTRTATILTDSDEQAKIKLWLAGHVLE